MKKISKILLSLCLIAFGVAFFIYIFSASSFIGGIKGIVAFILYIPTLALGSIFPVVSGFGLLVEVIKNKE